MNEVTLLAIDLAKRIFQLHAVDASGKVLFRKRCSRAELIRVTSNLKPCAIAMEACAGAHYWARKFESQGHSVKLIAAQFVRPFVKSNKNDALDAEAIAEAAQRPSMRFVSVKSVFHQDLQSLHRVRERVVRSRVALINEIHGLMHEYGIVLTKLTSKFLQELSELVAPEDERLTPEMKSLLEDMLVEYREMTDRLKKLNQKIESVCESHEMCKRLTQIPGIGPLTATAVVAAVGKPSAFKNGREMAAWIGLVPRQASSGGRDVLLGISKRGDKYLRTLLVHGARTVVWHTRNKTDRFNKWIQEKEQTRGRNRTVVAVANKNARIMWAMMTKNEDYKVA